ncbi:tRNA N(3)-methylcytidine methyltransferase METTL2 [Nematocida sp. AWRm80]|nr:tRNA N(3)-methylcytidine methyltransferase METTL2 [Nematocida sp. AWRm80]
MHGRVLSEETDKFSENAWDHVVISEEYIQRAQAKIENDNASIQPDHNLSYEPWDKFYQKHNESFYKERHWLLKEFPELEIPGKRICEIGCGCGSALVQLTHQTLFGVDYSTHAIEIIKNREEFKSGTFSVQDITQPGNLPYTNMDYILLIFTLSAVHPSTHLSILEKAKQALKPGGYILLRDYAYMDMTQLRFKPTQIIDTNFYRRGEGTYAYFFKETDITTLAHQLDLQVISCKNDKRLLINRKKKLEMQRNWIQVKLQKPLTSQSNSLN